MHIDFQLFISLLFLVSVRLFEILFITKRYKIVLTVYVVGSFELSLLDVLLQKIFQIIKGGRQRQRIFDWLNCRVALDQGTDES